MPYVHSAINKDTIAGSTLDAPRWEVFDSSRDGEPMAFLVGHRRMIPGFEEG